jgi:hypothetical protein
MAGKFNLREVGAIFLDATPNLEESISGGVGIVTYDANLATLNLTYQNQSQNSTTASMARSEAMVLAQNILNGVLVTANGPQVLVGAVYLPDGIVDPFSDSVLRITEQGLGPATMTVTVRSLSNQQLVVANYSITIQNGPGSQQAIVVTTQSGSTSGGGWFEVVASVDTPTAQGLIGGIRLQIFPTP